MHSTQSVQYAKVVDDLMISNVYCSSHLAFVREMVRRDTPVCLLVLKVSCMDPNDPYFGR